MKVFREGQRVYFTEDRMGEGLPATILQANYTDATHPDGGLYWLEIEGTGEYIEAWWTELSESV